MKSKRIIYSGLLLMLTAFASLLTSCKNDQQTGTTPATPDFKAGYYQALTSDVAKPMLMHLFSDSTYQFVQFDTKYNAFVTCLGSASWNATQTVLELSPCGKENYNFVIADTVLIDNNAALQMNLCDSSMFNRFSSVTFKEDKGDANTNVSFLCKNGSYWLRVNNSTLGAADELSLMASQGDTLTFSKDNISFVWNQKNQTAVYKVGDKTMSMHQIDPVVVPMELDTNQGQETGYYMIFVGDDPDRCLLLIDPQGNASYLTDSQTWAKGGSYKVGNKEFTFDGKKATFKTAEGEKVLKEVNK